MSKNNIKFKINSIDQEKAVVNKFIDQVDWFKLQNIRHNMPTANIEDEYDSSLYQEYLELAVSRWEEYADNFIESLLNFFNTDPKREFAVYVTQYGPWGFYDASNDSVIINRFAKVDVVRLIKHELTHIMVENYVKKYDLNHKQKEFIVETLGNMFNDVNNVKDPS